MRHVGPSSQSGNSGHGGQLQRWLCWCSRDRKLQIRQRKVSIRFVRRISKCAYVGAHGERRGELSFLFNGYTESPGTLHRNLTLKMVVALECHQRLDKWSQMLLGVPQGCWYSQRSGCMGFGRGIAEERSKQVSVCHFGLLSS